MLGSLRIITAVAVTVMVSLVGTATRATAQHSGNLDQCVNRGNAFSPDQRISACSAVLLENLTQKMMAYAFNNRALAFQSKGDYSRAIADYTDAIRLEPEFAHALYNRGTAYQATGDRDRAITDYTDAIRLDPAYFRAYKNRGLAYQANGDYDRANSDLNQASRLRPDSRR